MLPAPRVRYDARMGRTHRPVPLCLGYIINGRGASYDSLNPLDDSFFGGSDRETVIVVPFSSPVIRHVGRIVSRRVPPYRVEEIVHEVCVRAYFGISVLGCRPD